MNINNNKLTLCDEDYSFETQINKIPKELQMSAKVLFEKMTQFLRCPIKILDVVNDNIDLSNISFSTSLYGVDDTIIRFIFVAKLLKNQLIDEFDEFDDQFWTGTVADKEYSHFGITTFCTMYDRFEEES